MEQFCEQLLHVLLLIKNVPVGHEVVHFPS